MSKISSNLVNRPKEIIPVPPHHFISTRNLKIIQKNKESSRNKEKKDNYKKKFTYIPKNNYEPSHNESNSTSNNFVEQKSITYNSITKENVKDINKDKNINFANNNPKRSDIISIFDEKKLIKNTEKIPNNNNLVLISTNTRKNSKGNILIYGKNRQILPQKYQLNLNNNSNNNSILIGKTSPENKGKIIRIGDKFKNMINKERGKIITIEDIYINNSKNKILKKCPSKPNYNNNDNNNTTNNNNYRSTTYAHSDYSEGFNSEKIKKFRSLRPYLKHHNNLHSYQNRAPSRDLKYSNRTNIQSYTINIKNNSQIFENKNIIIPNYLREIRYNRKSQQNLIRDFIDKEQKIRSKSKKVSNNKMNNQVNNNNININNVYINLDNKNKDFFNNECEYRQLTKDDSNNKSFVRLCSKSNSNRDLGIKGNEITNNIKFLWKKIGGVTERYKINVTEKLNYLNKEDKYYFYIKEKEDIESLLNILEKLNKNIKIRNDINTQLKNITSYNSPKKEEITQLLLSLRMITINIINDYINFKKEISYDILNNKYNLVNIYNYPNNYLIQIENDTKYLYTHEYLSNIYKFSKYPDPFLLMPSKENKDYNKYIILPIDNYTIQEIQKANYFLIKEKLNREERKKSLVKSPSNYCNNAILIRNNNIVRKMNENKKIKIMNKNKFGNIFLCSNICNFNIENNNNNKNNYSKNNIICKDSIIEIINNNIKIFNKDIINICSKISDFEIIKKGNEKNKYKNNNIPCSNIVNLEIIKKSIIKKYNNIYFFNNNNFEIKNSPKPLKVIDFNNKISPCKKIVNLEIKNINLNRNNINNDNSINQNIPNDNLKKIENTKSFDPSKNIQQSPIYQKNIPVQANKSNSQIRGPAPFPQNIPSFINQEVCPYDEKNYPPIELIYNAYLKTVNNDIKISFKINPNIYYYSTIGASPKIILFKQNNSILYGIATLSYDSTQIYHRALMITSISCSNNYSISNTLLQLVDYCNKEIEYDELILYLYFYENENKKGEYILNEEFQNMIKTKTKFKWTALENSGNERKIKYHYKKGFSSNKYILQNNKIVQVIKNYTQLRFYRLIKYNNTNCDKGLNTKEYIFLFNVIDLVLKYGKEPNNNNDELNLMFSKINGLKKKRLLKMITEFNYVIYNKVNGFVEELAKNEDKVFSEVLFKKFLPFLQGVSKNQFLGFYYTDISANFSSIFKKRINGYEYNIISVTDFNIEVFRLSNEQNNDDYNNYLYFFKSENESISFIVYELDSFNEKQIIDNNDINNNYKNDLFNKLLKRILTKDNEEPARYYKKIGIPSFRYHPTLEMENKNQYKLTDYEILDGDDWFDFCIENNNNAILFSFPDKNIINEDVKIIENSFVIAIINPDLTVDYHIPALNIYYINKNCWIKR